MITTCSPVHWSVLRQSKGAGVREPEPDQSTDQKPISLEDLKGAFAEMLGQGEEQSDTVPSSREEVSQCNSAVSPDRDESDTCEITPRSILEAMLFVGGADNAALDTKRLASLMRGVEPAEIDGLVCQLNEHYLQRGAPFRIVSEGPGYRLALCEEYWWIRDRFYGRVREAKLSQAAIEVLSVVAYNQPVTSEGVSKFRGASSGAILSQLVRRQLLRVQRTEEKPRKTQYCTTERFLRVFSLESLTDLPRSEDLDA